MEFGYISSQSPIIWNGKSNQYNVKGSRTGYKNTVQAYRCIQCEKIEICYGLDITVI